jgi:glycosyltransferase involved in cell wall biosynthesis
MRIAIVASGLEMGGAERSLVKLIKVLEPLAERIDLLCLAGADEALIGELPSSVNLIFLGARSSANPIVWIRVHVKLRSLQPDLVLGWTTYANFVAVLATRLLPKCNVVLNERAYVPEVFSLDNCSRFRRRLALLLMRWLYRKAQIVTANSRSNVSFLKKYIGDGPAYRWLPNTIDTIEANRRAVEAPQPVLGDVHGPRILALGRLSFQKGFDILLRAMALVRATHPWTLVLVGDGPEKKSLINEADALGLGNSVRWIGKVQNPFPYYHWADLVVVPSRYEGFPNVPLEAMALGKAVICSDCKSGPNELIVTGKTGVLVQVGDANGLAKAIMKLASDPQYRLRLGEDARLHILHNYDSRMMASLYGSVLGLEETVD